MPVMCVMVREKSMSAVALTYLQENVTVLGPCSTAKETVAAVSRMMLWVFVEVTVQPMIIIMAYVTRTK